MQIKKHRLSLNGIVTSYYTGGSGLPVLFLHGGRVQAITFKKNLELLAKQFYVIAPDIPGYGNSSTPNTIWSFKEYAEFIDLFLKELNMKDVCLIGYSMGGGIALYMAENSDAIKKVVLIDPAGFMHSTETLPSADIKRLLYYLSHPRDILSLFILIRDYVKYLTRHVSDWQQMVAIREKSGAIGYQKQHTIKKPTLILWGKDDWVFPTKTGITLQQQIPSSTLEIVDGNHDWIVYNPKLFIDKVAPFLKEVNSNATV